MEGTSQPVDRQMEETPPPVRPSGQSLWSIQQRHNKVFNKEKYEKDKEKERIRIKILNKYKINFKNFVIYIYLIHFNKSKGTKVKKKRKRRKITHFCIDFYFINLYLILLNRMN